MQRLFLFCAYFLASCSLWLPDAVPLSTGTIADDTRVAAVLVADPVAPFLTPWVVLTPGAAPVFAHQQLVVALTAAQQTTLPWRTEAGQSYTPVVATLRRDAHGVLTLHDIDTTIREQTVASHDTKRLVRIIGTLQPRDGVLVLVDRREKTAFLPFTPPLAPDSPLAVALARVSNTAPEHLVEGVVSGSAYIPLVLAPVEDIRP